MTKLNSIGCLIRTSSDEDSDSLGRVYLGVCGREFRCDARGTDLRRGKFQMYSFGDPSNVGAPEANDPRDPQLQLEDADRYPIYLRFEQGTSDHWQMAYAMVRLNGDIHWHYNTIVENLWMGINSGACCHFRKLLHHHHAITIRPEDERLLDDLTNRIS